MSRHSSPKFSTSPLLWLAICFAVGILIQQFVSLPAPYPVAACILGGFATVLLRSGSTAMILLALTFMTGGVLSHSLELGSVGPDRIKRIYDEAVVHSGSPVEIEGTLTRGPDPAPDGTVLHVAAESLSYRGQRRGVSGTVRLLMIKKDESEAPVSEGNTLALKYGSQIRVACTLEREDEYLNPGVITRREMLDRMGVDATATVKSTMLIEHLADESVFIPLGWVYDLRSELISAFERGLSPSAAGVMTASLLGNRQFLDKATADVFREGGTFHILVISGLHITSIGGLLLFFVKAMTRNRWVQFLITISILWVYTLAVGADTPVVRAALMFTAALYAHAVYRHSAMLNMLGLCALVLLVWQPSSILDPSFHLTFLSVGSIASLGFPLIERLRSIGTWMPSPAKPFPPAVPDLLRRFCETLYWNEDIWSVESRRHIWTAGIFKSPYFGKYLGGVIQKGSQWIFEGLLISIIVQVCMLPVSVIYFHRFSATSVVLNLWVGFWIAIESFLAVVGAVCSLIADRLALPFFIIADAANSAMIWLPQIAAGTAFRVPEYPSFGKAFYVVHYVPLVIIAAALSRWRPFDVGKTLAPRLTSLVIPALLSSAMLSAIIILHPWSQPFPDGLLHIEFLDVGQGDSAFITFPAGETMLVDGGGRVEYGRSKTGEESDIFVRDVRGIGESVVSEVLWEKGYSAVDMVIATHADADHMQGLVDVVRNFKVRDAAVGGVPPEDSGFGDFSGALHQRKVPVQRLRAGDTLELSGVSVEVLHPRGEFPNISDNDQSVVILLTFGDRRILLTGDIEKTAEGQLVEGGLLRAVDIVKVAHHGSRTSSTADFVKRTSPRTAIISVGRSSPFRHPHPEVVERWKDAGASVLTTGEKGMITVSTDGKELKISRYLDDQQKRGAH